MDFIKALLKSLPATTLMAIIVPMICNKVGGDLKKKDANTTGKDDAAGNLIIATGNAFAVYDGVNDNAFRKSLKVARDAINEYLGDKTTTDVLLPNGLDEDKEK